MVTAITNSFGELPPELNSHSILKSHAPGKSVTDEIKLGTLACIYAIRKPEDTIASLIQAFGLSLEQSIFNL